MKLLAALLLAGAMFALLLPGEHLYYYAPGGVYRLEYRQALPDACVYRVTRMGGGYTADGVLPRGETARATSRTPELTCADAGLTAAGSTWQGAASMVWLPIVIR